MSGLLERQNLEVGQRDLVVPGPDSTITDGSEVEVAFARPVDLSVDGERDRVWTTALSVDELLGEIGVRSGAETSVSRSAAIGRDGLTLVISTPKDVTITVVGSDTQSQTLTTTATTAGEAVGEAGIRRGPGGRIVGGADAAIADGDAIRVRQAWTDTVTETVEVASKTVVREDSSMYEGESVVTQEGRAGTATRTVEVSYLGTVPTDREVVSRTVTTAPVNTVVTEGTKPRPAAPPVSAGPWDALAAV